MAWVLVFFFNFYFTNVIALLTVNILSELFNSGLVAVSKARYILGLKYIFYIYNYFCECIYGIAFIADLYLVFGI